MNSEDFVDAIQIAVRNAAIEGTVTSLTTPPGRSPDPRLIELSKWFADLDEGERRLVRALIERSVDQAVFGFLTVLDGVRAIENSPDKGVLELYYVRGERRVLINDPNHILLHEIYNSIPR